LLELSGLSFAYAHDQPALTIDTCEIKAGESVVLLGENGSGKTTLLRTIAGLCTPQRGTIRLLGRDVTQLSPARRSAQIAYLPHNPDVLFSRNSAEAEVAAALKRGPAMTCDVRAWLEQAGLPDQAAAHPLTLSHGERYRLALAMLLARSPDLLLLDEPTGSLDRAEIGLLCQLLAAFCASGRSAMTVTHDPDHLLRHGVLQRAIHLADHRLSEAALGADYILSTKETV
jgi:energy-coupling factor transporter ATP-binding protein EcfA2